MRRLQLGFLLFAFAVPAQTVRSKPELTLELQAKDPVDGVPQRVRFTLRNMSGHVLRVPEPSIQCNGTSGALWLRVTFKPADGAAPVREAAMPCASRPGNDNPRQWITLAPGGYLDRWYSAGQLRLRDRGAGRYTLQAEYQPPRLSAVMLRSLQGEDVLLPHEAAHSGTMELRR